jgi:glycosyltransferase involved in cell wall biosynthesis
MTASKHRLLYLVSEDWYFWSHRLPIARAARDAGFEVHVAARMNAHAQRLADEGFHVHPVGVRRGDARVWREIPVLYELARLYARLTPAIAHHVAMKPVVYGALAAKASPRTAVVSALAGLGYLFTSEQARRSVTARLVRQVLPRLLNGKQRYVLVQNDDDAAVLSSLGVARAAIRIVRGSGVDIEHYAPSPEPELPVLAVLVARLLNDKGVSELVEAGRILRQRNVPVRIAMVGGPDEENPGSVHPDTLRAWRAEGVVELWGARDDIASVWRQAHIAVLPSYREGLPKALLEAGASGRPIVATDVTGCRDVVVDGETGLLVPARDAQSLAAAIERLVLNPGLRQQMGAAARERVVNQFSEAQVVRETLMLYETALTGASLR